MTAEQHLRKRPPYGRVDWYPRYAPERPAESSLRPGLPALFYTMVQAGSIGLAYSWLAGTISSLWG